MLYYLNNNYHTFNTIAKNRLSARSFFVPFSNLKECKETAIEQLIDNSDMVQKLNGQWDFALFRNDKLNKKFETEKIKFTKINVPSSWQLEGYEPPFYLQDRYNFNCCPPHIPTQKSVGLYHDGKSKRVIKAFNEYNTSAIYRRIIEVSKPEDKNYILCFLGVSVCFDLYLNGNFVGYSQGSFNKAEFNVSKYLIAEQNEIVLVVRKWCNGSYLEAQDGFRLNGIFRDVLLFVQNKTFIYDYTVDIRSTNQERMYQCNLAVQVKNFQGYDLQITICNKDNQIVFQKDTSLHTEETILSYSDEFLEYSAEAPQLYKLYLVLLHNGKIIECVSRHIGFRSVDITKGKLLYNKKPIKIKGVVYEQWHNKQGYNLSYKDMKRDILLMKKYNINAVRLVRPPHPIFIELCTKLGIYVFAEADIDTSGTAYSPFYRPNMISKNRRWKEHFWDRVERLYHSLKNASCLVMWGLGSSSGGIRCQEYCYNNLKRKSSLPIYYDNAVYTRKIAFDVFTLKNCTLSELYNIDKAGYMGKQVGNKPILLTEYVTVGGACGGGMGDYVALMKQKSNIIGGFVKGFVDKVCSYDKGKFQFNYGKENGQFIDDGVQGMHGLFSVHRRPYASAENIKYLYRPISARLINNETVEFCNTNFFIDTKDIKIQLDITSEGHLQKSWDLEDILQPQQRKKYDILAEGIERDTMLNISYIHRSSGDIIATEQFCLHKELVEVPITAGRKIEVKEFFNNLMVEFDNGLVRFDKLTGVLLNYQIDGVETLAVEPAKLGSSGLMTNILCPLNQRDKNKRKYRQYSATRVVKEFGYTLLESPKAVEVCTKVELCIKSGLRYLVKNVYTIFANGHIKVYCVMQPTNAKSFDLQCFGKVVRLAYDCHHITYYGRGPKDNYIDMQEHAPIGLYSHQAEDFWKEYVCPQQSGNRSQVRYIIAQNPQGYGLMFNALHQPFSLQVNGHARQVIDNAWHQEELDKRQGVFLYLNNQMKGISSFDNVSIMKKYKVMPSDNYKIAFEMLPIFPQ